MSKRRRASVEKILFLYQLKPGMSGIRRWLTTASISFDSMGVLTRKGPFCFNDFATGRVKEIVTLGSDILHSELAISSDRRSFFYTVWEHQAGADITLVENFR